MLVECRWIDIFISNQANEYRRTKRQSVIKLGVEADEVAAEAMIQAVMGNAHGEEIELWASRIRGVMVECEEMLLVELQQKSGLNLVDLWLGLLLGDTGCLLRRQLSCDVEFNVDFYDRSGIWIVETIGG